MSPKPRQPAPEPESDPDGSTFYDSARVHRSGPGRRAEDTEIRDLIRSKLLWRILGGGGAILLSVATWNHGYTKGLGAENDALRADNMRLFQQRVNDDQKQQIYEARTAAVEARTVAARNEIRLDAMESKVTAELKKVSAALDSLRAEIRRSQ